jgi:transcription initiation factor IIE alpha subunit
MIRRLTHSQIKKYDVSQKIIIILTNPQSHAILFSIIKKGNTAGELSRKLKIPLGTVYKKLIELEDLSLIKIEKIILTDKGRRERFFRSKIRGANIIIKTPVPTLILLPQK